MDVEAIFMNCFSINKKPADIFELIEAAIAVGELKYPALFEKRKSRILKMISSDRHDLILDDDEEEDDGDDTSSTIDDGEEKDSFGDDEGKQNDVVHTQSNDKITVPTKRVPLQKQQLLSDCSPQFKKLEEGEQTTKEKQSHKGFKKMESLVEKKREEQTPTQRRNKTTSGLMKSMPPLMKMNVATKRAQLLSDCSPQKQSNCRAITRPMQSSAVARPIQKETQSIRDRNMKFESSKRKFEERFAEQREAKRRIIMVDFHDMPKPTNDPRAPRRRC